MVIVTRLRETVPALLGGVTWQQFVLPRPSIGLRAGATLPLALGWAAHANGFNITTNLQLCGKDYLVQVINLLHPDIDLKLIQKLGRRQLYLRCVRYVKLFNVAQETNPSGEWALTPDYNEWLFAAGANLISAYRVENQGDFSLFRSFVHSKINGPDEQKVNDDVLNNNIQGNGLQGNGLQGGVPAGGQRLHGLQQGAGLQQAGALPQAGGLQQLGAASGGLQQAAAPRANLPPGQLVQLPLPPLGSSSAAKDGQDFDLTEMDRLRAELEVTRAALDASKAANIRKASEDISAQRVADAVGLPAKALVPGSMVGKRKILSEDEMRKKIMNDYCTGLIDQATLVAMLDALGSAPPPRKRQRMLRGEETDDLYPSLPYALGSVEDAAFTYMNDKNASYEEALKYLRKTRSFTASAISKFDLSLPESRNDELNRATLFALRDTRQERQMRHWFASRCGVTTDKVDNEIVKHRADQPVLKILQAISVVKRHIKRNRINNLSMAFSIYSDLIELLFNYSIDYFLCKNLNDLNEILDDALEHLININNKNNNIGTPKTDDDIDLKNVKSSIENISDLDSSLFKLFNLNSWDVNTPCSDHYNGKLNHIHFERDPWKKSMQQLEHDGTIQCGRAYCQLWNWQGLGSNCDNDHSGHKKFGHRCLFCDSDKHPACQCPWFNRKMVILVEPRPNWAVLNYTANPYAGLPNFKSMNLFYVNKGYKFDNRPFRGRGGYRGRGYRGRPNHRGSYRGNYQHNGAPNNGSVTIVAPK